MSDYFEKYKNRLRRYGDNIGESLTSNTTAFINATFNNSPTYRQAEAYAYDKEMRLIDVRVIEVERLGTLREIILKPNDDLDIGNILKFDGESWLLYDKYGGTGGSASVKMMAIKCNNVIKWKRKDGKVASYDCVASASDIGSKAKQSKNEIEWNKYDVTLPSGQLFVSCELNEDTKTIELNDRFIFGRNVYEVTGIDDVTSVDQKKNYGVVQFTIKIDIKRATDDFVNGIAENTYLRETDDNDDIIDDGNEGESGGELW